MFERWRKPKHKVGDHVMDTYGRCWVIDSISGTQYVIHLFGTTIYHAETASSMKRYSAHRPPSGV